jgi:hypothetical protein
MEKPKQVLARDRLEAELLAALRKDPGSESVEKGEVRRVESPRGANWNLAKISPPIVLGGGTRWQSIKQTVIELQHRYDMADEEPAMQPPDDQSAVAMDDRTLG